MRMFHYYVAVTAVVVPALLLTSWLGISGRLDAHFKLALVTAIATIGAHSLMILFMILTGRILKEAVRQGRLSLKFLDELNDFFSTRKAYPAAILSAFAIVAAGVLAFAQVELGLPRATHMLAGLGALILNLWTFPLELATLRRNQGLVDRAAQELDRQDRENERAGTPAIAHPPRPAAVARGALIVCVSAWMPYLYWALVEWRGDFSRVSVHPWIEVSALAALVWLIARSEAKAPAGSGRE